MNAFNLRASVVTIHRVVAWRRSAKSVVNVIVNYRASPVILSVYVKSIIRSPADCSSPKQVVRRCASHTATFPVLIIRSLDPEVSVSSIY
jgi:hypothetical protein